MTSDLDDSAIEFSRLLGPLRRAVLRLSRQAADLPDLPEAQIELLRLLVAEGSLSPREAAGALQVAPSTISNLVKAMRATGLVARDTDPEDARTARLSATRTALDLLDRYDRASATALQRSLAQLPPGERARLDAALPALRSLTATLDSDIRAGS
ncbi:MarR family transcriptional regulator [Saccharopolyspora rhizosphaerae]|uniref:MarR family transcriptional regulator n=1 Tax=Saccharopolyspora rhizosphaerae TaxID=2492662 RepID=A0A3R8QGS7_9PSEU|nr:MarR family transcriptional regulator [Saccharopolyspora rhizosphaerae]RRO20661.1 MarR family transcriptional regulator [Saccharopolyspora rhizosphaerae]